MRKISWNKIIGKFIEGFNHFSIWILSFFVVSIWSLLQNHQLVDTNTSWRIYVITIGGAIWSVSATLFCEHRYSPKTTFRASLGVYLLWTTYALLLPDIDKMNAALSISFSALCTVAVFSLFFVSFFGCKDEEICFWNFSQSTLCTLLYALLFGLIIQGGLSLAVFALDSLFSLSVGSRCYGDLTVLCHLLFVPIYFVCNLPEKENKFNNKLSIISKTTKVLSLYILLPITTIYFVILYAYMAKILFTWTLPQGMVTWLVSVSMVIYFLIITFCYPLFVRGENKVAEFVSRYMGLIALPLVVLMSVGILYRINQYGITISRGYVLLLNIWFYAMIVWLTLTKSHKIRLIPISFCVIFFISSIGPWSVANVTYKTISGRLKDNIQKSGAYQDGKLDEMAFLAYVNANDSIAEQIFTDKRYLDVYYRNEYEKDLFSENSDDNYQLFHELLNDSSYDFASKEKKVELLYETNDIANIPQETGGYKYYIHVDYCTDKIKIEDDRLMIDNIYKHDNITIPLPTKEYKEDEMFTYVYKDGIVHLKYLKGVFYPERDSNRYEINRFECDLFYNFQE